MHLTDLTWPEVGRLDKSTPIVFPVAALEQHGEHMPLFTDSLLMGEVANRAHDAVGAKFLLAPLTWLGNSHHHLDYPGTLSADPRVYLDLLVGLYRNAVAHGFTRILIVNGHGGNDVPGRQAVFEVRQQLRDRTDLLLLFGTYWNLVESPNAAIDGLVQTEMGHACEWETSMVLSLAPHLVKPHTAVAEVPFGTGFAPANRGWVMGDRSTPGHIGTPAAATAAKGAALFDHFARGLVKLIERMAAWDGTSFDG